MRNIIVGTAGHIDHGKTALVRALTGIDTDRLEEEKRRGISIDLGFANLDLPGIRCGFVDVPGHERFVRNMLAGVGGIDLVVLVIAADEGIKPQTREHFEICRLLGIQRGVVAITKRDLVDDDWFTLVRMEIDEALAGSFLAGAPRVGVSAKTGLGLEELKAAIVRVARETPVRSSGGYFRLPVDRAFTLKGFGTVVTGTLASGALRVEEEVEVHPLGRRLRVRGVQVHGSGVERAEAGQRTAVNLAGIEPGELRRGMVLTAPGLFHATAALDAELEWLPGVELKDRAPVHFHTGTAEVEAEYRALGEGWGRFHLAEPLLVWPGDRFILRRFSPVVTIGGGRVLDIDAGKRLRRKESEARLVRIREAGLEEVLLQEARFGLAPAALVARTAAPVKAEAGWLAHPRRVAEALDALREMLRAFHAAQPLQPGMSREEARQRLTAGAVPAAVFDEWVARDESFAVQGDLVRLASHRVKLAAREDDALLKIEESFRSAGLAAPSTEEVLKQSGVDLNKARTLLQALVREKKLIRVNLELTLHAEAVSGLRALMARKRGERFQVGAFKEWTGVSRKYAIPILEYLDRERVTRREGDARVVL